MSPSFIPVSKIPEYFQNTVAYVMGELTTVMDICIKLTGPDSCQLELYTRDGMNCAANKHVMEDVNYDSFLEIVKPFLPGTQYFFDGQRDWLCGYTPINSWKRSLSSERYREIQPVCNIKGAPVPIPHNSGVVWATNFGAVTPRTLEEVLSLQEHNDLTALSKDFALYEGRDVVRPVVLYHQLPIAVVNDYGVMEPHPRYYEQFHRKLSLFGEVRYVDKRTV